jgi:hypothetical protein
MTADVDLNGKYPGMFVHLRAMLSSASLPMHTMFTMWPLEFSKESCHHDSQHTSEIIVCGGQS